MKRYSFLHFITVFEQIWLYLHYSFQVEDSSDVLLRAQKGHKNVRKCIYLFFYSWIPLIRPPLGHENMVVLKAWSYKGRTNIVLRGGGRLGNFQIKNSCCWKKDNARECMVKYRAIAFCSTGPMLDFKKYLAQATAQWKKTHTQPKGAPENCWTPNKVSCDKKHQ